MVFVSKHQKAMPNRIAETHDDSSPTHLREDPRGGGPVNLGAATASSDGGDGRPPPAETSSEWKVYPPPFPPLSRPARANRGNPRIAVASSPSSPLSLRRRWCGPPGVARAVQVPAAAGCSYPRAGRGGAAHGVLQRCSFDRQMVRRGSGVLRCGGAAPWRLGAVGVRGGRLAAGVRPAAPSRPRSGLFGPHLGLGGPSQTRRRLSWSTEVKELVPGCWRRWRACCNAAAGTLRAHSGLGRASEGLVCP